MIYNLKAQCLEQWELCRESGTAAVFAPVADLAANVKQIPTAISIASYVYHFVGVYLVVYLIVYFYVLVMG